MLYLVPPSTKRGLMLGGLFGFWRQHIPYLNVLIETIYRVIHEGPDVEWRLEQEKAVQQGKPSIQAALLIGPHDPGDPMILRVSMANTDVLSSPLQAPIGEYQTSRVLG